VPVIPAFGKAKARGLLVQGQPGQYSKTMSQNKNKNITKQRRVNVEEILCTQV
jgi:hypothetical protein